MTEPSARKRILFVCVENSDRSQMAEAFARLHGGEAVEAFSAGSEPSGRINPRAMIFMDERDYDLSRHASKSLDEIPPGEYDALVTLARDQAFSGLPARLREDWNVPDPRYLSPAEFRSVRDLIERKVKDLLARLVPGV
jgi:protein-tyrosine-phosphatase